MHLFFGIKSVLEEEHCLITADYLKIVFAALKFREKCRCPPYVSLLSLLEEYFFLAALPLFLASHYSGKIRIAMMYVYLVHIISGLNIYDQLIV